MHPAVSAVCCCCCCRLFHQVTGHHRLLETNPALRRLIEMRNPYIDPINILQVGAVVFLVAGTI